MRFLIAALDLMGQTPYRPGSPAGWPDTAEQWGGADVLGANFRAETRKAVARAASAIQGTTPLLASPDFQRR